MISNYTYKDLTKPEKRELMKSVGVCNLGTKSGGFGEFKPDFKVVSSNGVLQLKDEILTAGLDVDSMPIIKKLIEE